MTPPDVSDAAVCPTCNGHGGTPYFVCCGRGLSECCGEPDVDMEPCFACGGSGQIPTDDRLRTQENAE